MSVAANLVRREALRHLIPLNLLPQDQFKQLCDGLTSSELKEGECLFERGDECDEWIYILQGDVVLEAEGIVMETVKAGTDAARFPLAQHVPRKVTARALTQLRYIQLDYQHLNLMENYRPKASKKSKSKGDWVTKLLKSPVFQRLPASNLQKIINQFEEFEAEAGQSIIEQGEEGDYLYIIKAGQCVVSRKPRPNAKEIKLGSLKVGDMVGEDALITGSPRSVSVSMLTDGLILKLAKEDFLELIVKPVLSKVTFEAAYRDVGQEDIWLDVRDPDEFKKVHIQESINIPFFSLRMQLGTLQRSRRYIVVCEDGVTSAAAAFLLLRYGFEAAFLDGGMTSVPAKSLVGEEVPLEEASQGGGAETQEAVVSLRVNEKPEKNQLELLTDNQENLSAQVKDQPESAIQLSKVPDLGLEQQKDEIQKLQIERDRLKTDKAQLQDKLRELETLLQEARTQNETDQLKQELEWLRSERDKDKEKITSLQQQIDELESVIQQYFGTTDVQRVEVRVQALIAELHEVRDASDKELEAMRSEVERLKAELARVNDTSETVLPVAAKQESGFLPELSPVDPQHLPLNNAVDSNRADSSQFSKVSASIMWILVGVLLSMSIVGMVFQMESGRRLLAKALLADSRVSVNEKNPASLQQNEGGKVESSDNLFKDENTSESSLFEGEADDSEKGDGDLFDSE